MLVIPALAFVVAAGLQTSLSVRQATTLSDLAEQVALGREVTALVHELQFERDRVSGGLAALAAQPANAREADRQALAGSVAPARQRASQARTAFDRAAAPLRNRPVLGEAIGAATAALDELTAVQVGFEAGWLRQLAVFDGYTRAIEALLALLRAPAAAEDAQLRGYQELAELKEVSARIRGEVFAITSAGTVEPGAGVTPGALERLVDTRAQRTAARERFRATATPEQLARFDETVRGQAVRASARLEQAVVDRASAGALDVDPEQWWAASTTELEFIREVEGALLADAYQQVALASQDRWRQTGLVTGAAVVILLLSLLMSVRIGRSMVRSLRQLRRQAINVAHVQLPGLLARLRDARGTVPAVPEVARITAGGADEVGDVADAFTQVHRSAVQLAVEQAVMRRNVNAIFVNLARRSQVLVERQLELLDDLEQDETEPRQLGSLFRLDHLATRMRRNNESLLVLAGSDLARSYHRPVPLAAVTIAAIAEIEQYQRVREDVAADLHVVGGAVSDLVHLLAELLDNATTFSAPETIVYITGRRLPGVAGTLVEISDSGMGMPQTALNQANALLAAPPVIDVAASERMGLVVVGHLAARHGIRVQLTAAMAGGAGIASEASQAPAGRTGSAGIRARVWLPESALAAPPTDAEPPKVRVPAGRVVRAEDVLANNTPAPEPGSTWWAPTAPAGTATLLAPAPIPVVAGTSANGLPIRVPMAHLPRQAGDPPVPARGGWQAADPDPELVGSTLSRLYGGIRRAETETEAEPGTSGSADGERQQGST